MLIKIYTAQYAYDIYIAFSVIFMDVLHFTYLCIVDINYCKIYTNR